MGGLLAAGQLDDAAGCAWNLGWAELCLGGLLDGQGLFHTHLGLSLGGELLAGPLCAAFCKQTSSTCAAAAAMRWLGFRAFVTVPLLHTNWAPGPHGRLLVTRCIQYLRIAGVVL